MDVALRYGGPQSTELYSECLVHEGLIVVAAPTLVSEGPVEPAHIAKLPLLHDQFHPHWDIWAEAAGIDPGFQSKSSPFPDSAVLIAAAIDGQGAVLVRKILVADDLKAGRLVCLSDIGVEQEKALLFVCRNGDQGSPPLRVFRAWLAETCSRL